MRILFLQRSGIDESLALCDLSAVLKAAGHETRLLLGDEESRLEREIVRYDPGLVLFPCAVGGEAWPLEWAAKLVKLLPRVPVGFAGTHATFEAEACARATGVSAVVVGESEHAVCAWADCLEKGASWDHIENLCFVRDQQVIKNPLRPLIDVRTLPPPDRELYFRYPYLRRFPWKKFGTGRGCVHTCSFCWNTLLKKLYQSKGSFVRRKDPQRVVEEVLAVRRTSALRHVHFSDDLFTVHPEWLEQFAPLYKEQVGIPFTCNTSVELVTERAVAALSAAGCKGVAVGVESGNDQLRKQILGKNVTSTDIAVAAERIRRHHMELTTFNMIAVPGETLGHALETLRLNQAIGTHAARLNIALATPHSPFAEQAQAMGIDQKDAATSRKINPEVVFSSPDADALLRLYYLFRIGLRYPQATPWIQKLVQLPISPLLRPLSLLGPLEERRIYDLSWHEGLRYWWHVGDPNQRTTNYVSLV